MFFTRGHPALRALIGAAVLVTGLLIRGLILIVAGAVVAAWGITAGIAAALAASRGRGLIGGEGSGGAR